MACLPPTGASAAGYTRRVKIPRVISDAVDASSTNLLIGEEYRQPADDLPPQALRSEPFSDLPAKYRRLCAKETDPQPSSPSTSSPPRKHRFRPWIAPRALSLYRPVETAVRTTVAPCYRNFLLLGVFLRLGRPLRERVPLPPVLTGSAVVSQLCPCWVRSLPPIDA